MYSFGIKIWIVLNISVPVYCSSFDMSASGLTTFPLVTPSTVTAVVVSDNAITVISASDLDGLGLLAYLYAANNSLTEFPDVRPVGSTLSYLSLQDNQISVVNPDYFQGVTKLSQLFLYNNNIAVFPDFGDSKPSLSWLFLFANPIADAPLDVLLDFHSLTSFLLQDNLLEDIPNSCNASFWNRIISPAWGLGRMRCNCKLLHAYHAVNFSSHFGINTWECQSPQSMVGMSYDSGLTLDELTCNETGSMGRLMKLVKSDFYCHYPYVIQRISVASAKECAVICVQTEGCYYFNVRQDYGQLAMCDITSVLATSDNNMYIVNSTGWQYYSIL